MGTPYCEEKVERERQVSVQVPMVDCRKLWSHVGARHNAGRASYPTHERRLEMVAVRIEPSSDWLRIAQLRGGARLTSTAYIRDKAGTPTLSWRVLILPYLGRDDLYRQIKLDDPWDSPSNLCLAHQVPEIYRCPAHAASKEGETSYLAVVGAQTAWPGSYGAPLPALTRAPGTILVVEATGYGISWMEPRDLPIAD